MQLWLAFFPISSVDQKEFREVQEQCITWIINNSENNISDYCKSEIVIIVENDQYSSQFEIFIMIIICYYRIKICLLAFENCIECLQKTFSEMCHIEGPIGEAG